MFGFFVQEFNDKQQIWGRHDAPIIRLVDGDLYVLDPVIKNEPMKKVEYHAELVNSPFTYIDEDTIPTTTKRSRLDGYVTCKTNTYNWHANCFHPASLEDQLKKYLIERATKYLLDL